MRQALSFVLVGIVACGMCAASACGTSSSHSNGAADGSAGDAGPVTNLVGEGGLTLGEDGSVGALVIQPQNATLNVTAPGVTQQFTALVGSTPTSAEWSIDTAGVGTIDSNGLFTASGTLGGTIEVSANTGGLNASTGLTIHLTLT